MLDYLVGLFDLSFFYEISLQGFFKWVKDQAKWLLYIALIGILIYTVVQRAWLRAIGIVFGLAFVAIFIEKPEIIISISSWLSKLLSIGG